MKNIGERIRENYENRFRFYLPRRIPVIIRLDGKAFHTLTKQCKRPFDAALQSAMMHTAHDLVEEIQGAKFAYTQSDEISILVTDFDRLTTDAWFNYNIQKICSISAAIASTKFRYYWDGVGNPLFDARCFSIPKEEVNNYFVWRQKDWERNSVQMLAQANFSHRELQNKSKKDIHEMLHKKCINWAKLDDVWKNGTVVFSNRLSTPFIHSHIFQKNPELVDNFLINGE